MKFCTNCGKQLNDDAKFCDTCGAPVSGTQTPPPIPGANENVADDTKRKEVFVGVKRKCPVCGEEVPAFALTCPKGHELSGINVSKTSKDFQEGLIKYEGKEERDFVASFPIPNEREELGNFMLMVASILKQDMQNGADQMRVSSFSSKFDEIKSKVYMMFKKDDPIFEETKKWEASINELYDNYKKIIEERAIINRKKQKEQERKNRKWERKRNSFWYNASNQTKAAIISVFFLFFIFPGLLCSMFIPKYIKTKNETRRLENLYTEVTTLIENKNYEAAELALQNMVWSYDLSGWDKDEYRNARGLWAGKKKELQNLIDERQSKKKSK
ncbi:putative nucleic acid-binding Zn ribbon protein [Treponema rectale]|uniref:Putative nucleic acid-binding Zn ribbon protein n=1 Tax=Treponema rectale TaxID=744512 RepID=A0A840SG31_9SPIR|nr:zinc ribbon domain-containing protein [Treponema rectale]MBB5219675.1 putative nucleic acid-binding Zn ribbon protein [Treponema rectale]